MPNRKKRECAIRFILGPKSVIAFFTAKGPIRHGSVKLHGSPSFWSKLLWTTAEHSSLSLTEKAAFFSFSLELWHPLACGSWPPEKALSKRPSNVGFIISEIEETFLDGEVGKLIEFSAVLMRYVIMKDLDHKPFLYSMVGDLTNQILKADPGAFDRFVSSLLKSKDHVSISRELKMFPVHLAGKMIGFWKPAELGWECSCKVLRGVDDLIPPLVDDDASSSKRFLPAIVKDSF
ncbi:hypothetical protein Tco_1189367 [Tanacetum coccineum]